MAMESRHRQTSGQHPPCRCVPRSDSSAACAADGLANLAKPKRRLVPCGVGRDSFRGAVRAPCCWLVLPACLAAGGSGGREQPADRWSELPRQLPPCSSALVANNCEPNSSAGTRHRQQSLAHLLAHGHGGVQRREGSKQRQQVSVGDGARQVEDEQLCRGAALQAARGCLCMAWQAGGCSPRVQWRRDRRRHPARCLKSARSFWDC